MRPEPPISQQQPASNPTPTGARHRHDGPVSGLSVDLRRAAAGCSTSADGPADTAPASGCVLAGASETSAAAATADDARPSDAAATTARSEGRVGDDVVARAKAALVNTTDGPWYWDGMRVPALEVADKGADAEIGYGGYDHTVLEADHRGECGCRSACELTLEVEAADAEFIAAARTLVPELVAEVERLRAPSELERRHLAELSERLAETELALERSRSEARASAEALKHSHDIRAELHVQLDYATVELARIEDVRDALSKARDELDAENAALTEKLCDADEVIERQRHEITSLEARLQELEGER